MIKKKDHGYPHISSGQVCHKTAESFQSFQKIRIEDKGTMDL